MSDSETGAAEPLERGDVEVRSDEIPDDAKSAPDDRETAGPFDVKEVPAMRPYVDFGAIKVAPREGLQLRLDVDETAKRVVAVSIDFEGSTLQVQAFAAPKTTGLWHQVRTQIANQLRGQGATITEQTSQLGPELVTTVRLPEERGGGTSAMRFVGVDGPRWLLRGLIIGAAASDPEASAAVEGIFRELVVVRGDQPLPPSELLQLKVPANAQGTQKS